MAILEVQSVYKTFRQGFLGLRRQVLSGLDLTLEAGEVYGFLGHNGAGKSTTMKLILGLIRPDAGSVRLFGSDGASPQARSRIGYLGEDIGAYPHLTAPEMLRLAGELFRLRGRILTSRIDELITLVNLADARKLRIKHFSKGMRQRLGVALALINDPDLLLLDEPYSGLDPVGRKQLRELLTDLKARGKTILLSSHIVPDVEAVCDRVGILSGGKIVKVLNLHEIYGSRGDAMEVIVSDVPDGRLNVRDYGGEALRTDKNTLTVKCSGDRRLQSLVADVYAAGGRVLEVRAHKWRLEDVFIELINSGGARTGDAMRAPTNDTVLSKR